MSARWHVIGARWHVMGAGPTAAVGTDGPAAVLPAGRGGERLPGAVRGGAAGGGLPRRGRLPAGRTHPPGAVPPQVPPRPCAHAPLLRFFAASSWACPALGFQGFSVGSAVCGVRFGPAPHLDSYAEALQCTLC